MSRINVIGTGYVGLVSGVCLAEIGHTVICSDVSEEKIKVLNEGGIPIYEPGLKELLDRNFREGRLTFTNDIDKAIKGSEVIFSAVGTPMGRNHEADLTYIRQVAESFARNLDDYKILVTKSTVPVGTADMVAEVIAGISQNEFDVVSNPEFLREGTAVKDFMIPDRIVIGCATDRARNIMQEIYEPLQRTQSPIIFTDIKSAELIKYAANSMLATRISFMNEIARYCDLVGANVREVSHGIGLDKRIGPRFLQAGIGYGGSCFPKDVNALIESGKAAGYDFMILSAVDEVNKQQRDIIVDKLKKHIPDLSGKIIAVWGLSFKPMTDDVREAPAAKIIEKLLGEGAKVRVFDPVAQPAFKREYPDLDIEYCDKDKCQATENADALMVLTEWNQFRALDYDRLQHMNHKMIFDGRNIYNNEHITQHGFSYEGIGNN